MHGGGADIGYHYTDQRNMDNIRTHGLLTKAERDTNKVTAAPKGRYVLVYPKQDSSY